MCNVFEQCGRVVKPGGKVVVFLRGPGGVMQVEANPDGTLPRPFFVPLYAGAAKSEKVEYLWVRQKKGQEVLIPGVTKFGDWHVKKNCQLSHDLPPGSALAGVILPEVIGKNGKTYRLLKVQTRAATPQEEEIVGNDRMPVVVPWPDPPEFPLIEDDEPPRSLKPGRATPPPREKSRARSGGEQMELF